MVKIGEDRAERRDIIPARFQVIVTVRPRYACRRCDAGVIQAATPHWLIEGGLPTEGTLAHVAVSKYADHLPLYRQCQIYGRGGVDLDRSTLASWCGTAAYHLAPVVDRMLVHLKRSSRLLMDETRAPVLDPGAGKTKTGYLWALTRDDRGWGGDDPPAVVFTYAPGRHGSHAMDMPHAASTASCRSMDIPDMTPWPNPGASAANLRRWPIAGLIPGASCTTSIRKTASC